MSSPLMVLPAMPGMGDVCPKCAGGQWCHFKRPSISMRVWMALRRHHRRFGGFFVRPHKLKGGESLREPKYGRFAAVTHLRILGCVVVVRDMVSWWNFSRWFRWAKWKLYIHEKTVRLIWDGRIVGDRHKSKKHELIDRLGNDDVMVFIMSVYFATEGICFMNGDLFRGCMYIVWGFCSYYYHIIGNIIRMYADHMV